MEYIKRKCINEKFLEAYDDYVSKAIPFYNEMIDTLVLSIPYSVDATIEVIDLGCGTGVLGERILRQFQRARVTCLDRSINMIEKARMKLKDFNNRMIYEVGKFEDYRFNKKYHVIVSSLTLHHIVGDEAKIKFFFQSQ